jgi:hypothetical protein
MRYLMPVSCCRFSFFLFPVPAAAQNHLNTMQLMHELGFVFGSNVRAHVTFRIAGVLHFGVIKSLAVP